MAVSLSPMRIIYRQDEIVGENHLMVVPKEEKKSDEYRQIGEICWPGSLNRGFKRVNKKGDIKRIKANYSPVRNRSGEVIKVMVIGYDITGYKNASQN